MQYDMELQWRPGTKHQFADALSRSHGHKTRGATVGDSFPSDNTTNGTYRGPLGPVLDGVHLGRLGIEGINNNDALPLTVLAAVTFTPDLPPTDTNPAGHRPLAHSLDSAPILPKAMVIGCGWGSSIRALSDIFEFTGITDHDWRAMECTRVNGRATEAQFKRTCPGDPEYGSWVKSRELEVIIENTSRRANELEEGQQGTTGAATNIVHTFISSQAHLLILESTPYLLKSANWMGDLSPLLSTTGCCWEAVELSAQQVGIPSTKRKTFVAWVWNHPNAEERLARWKARLTDISVRPVTLGEFIGREGSYFLSRKKSEHKIFSFEDPIMSLTRGHILEEKPPLSGYQPHPSDVDSLEDAQELHLTDFATIATGFEDYIFPPTLNRSAIATLLVDSTPGGIMLAVITCLLATGSLPKTPTISPDWEQEGLSCAAFNVSHTDETTDEPNLVTTIAPVVTRKRKQRMLHRSRTSHGSRQPTPPASPGKMPPPTPVAPPPQTQAHQR